MESDMQERNATTTVEDEDVYVLNPVFRLRNEADHIRLWGWEGKGDYSLHHTVGIVIALCNGKRAVREIAQAVVPFVKQPDAENAVDDAGLTVKRIIAWFLKSQAEQTGKKESSDGDIPSDAALIEPALLSRFRCRPAPEYDARQFLPRYAPARGDNPSPRKERVPSMILWHLTSACSVDCRYCYLKRRRPSEANPLPFARVLEIVEECKKIGVFELDPSGGDVLVYPHFFEFLDAINDPRLSPIRLSTKTYCGKETARRLAAYPNIFSLQFSIDSTVDEAADFLTRTPGFCKRILESIDNTLDAGLSVGAKTVITPYNILTVPRLYRDLRRRGVWPIRLAAYVRSGFHHTEDLYNHPESYEWLMREIDSLKEEFPEDLINVQNGAPGLTAMGKEARQERWKARSRCTAGRSAMMICSDGKVIPCEQMPETEEYFCGDVRVQSVQEVWDSKELDERTIHLPRERFRGSPCYTCEEFENCIHGGGYCIRDTSAYQGTIYTTPQACPRYEGPFLRTV